MCLPKQHSLHFVRAIGENYSMYISQQMLVAILVSICIAPPVYSQHVRVLNAGASPTSEASPPTVIQSILAPYTDERYLSRLPYSSYP
jgi:hypothetical protein